jgi:hypothetical protein
VTVRALGAARIVLVAAGLAFALSACGSGGSAEIPWPNINKVPDRPKRKLMTAEESQAAIADVEAKAKSQIEVAACNDPDIKQRPKDWEKCPTP